MLSLALAARCSSGRDRAWSRVAVVAGFRGEVRGDPNAEPCRNPSPFPPPPGRARPTVRERPTRTRSCSQSPSSVEGHWVRCAVGVCTGEVLFGMCPMPRPRGSRGRAGVGARTRRRLQGRGNPSGRFSGVAGRRPGWRLGTAESRSKAWHRVGPCPSTRRGRSIRETGVSAGESCDRRGWVGGGRRDHTSDDAFPVGPVFGLWVEVASLRDDASCNALHGRGFRSIPPPPSSRSSGVRCELGRSCPILLARVFSTISTCC